MKTSRPYWAIPLTILCMFVAILAGSTPAALLLNQSTPLYQLAAGLGVTVTMVLLVYLWRRYLLRQPWSGVGLRWTRSAIPQALLGTGIAATVALAANAASVAIGAATWTSWPDQGDRIGYIVAILSVSILLQGFPEELLWRGHTYDVLSKTMSPRTVLVLTSVTFGSLHIISDSGATGIGERLLYVVMAMAFGFACGAARARTGAVWMAIGIHSGFHIGLRVLPTEPSNYVTWVVLLTVTMTLAGTLILGRSLTRTREPAPLLPSPSAPCAGPR